MWLGSHYALLSGTGLASIIVVAKARGTGKKSVPRSVLEKKEDKERKKKERGKKSIKSFFSCCVFFSCIVGGASDVLENPCPSHSTKPLGTPIHSCSKYLFINSSIFKPMTTSFRPHHRKPHAAPFANPLCSPMICKVCQGLSYLRGSCSTANLVRFKP